MALSTAERQAIYRTKRSTAGDNGERRLNAWISTAAAAALKRLAAYEGTTQKEVIERLILQADQSIIGAFGSNDLLFEKYINAPLTRRHGMVPPKTD